jgi:hypothetical protein
MSANQIQFAGACARILKKIGLTKTNSMHRCGFLDVADGTASSSAAIGRQQP